MEDPSGLEILSSLAYLLGIAFVYVAVWWKIFSKAGYSGLMGVLMIVPLANLVALAKLVFSEWPIHKEVASLRNRRLHDVRPQSP